MRGFLPSQRTSGLWSIGIALSGSSALAEAGGAVRESSLRLAFQVPPQPLQQVLTAVRSARPNILILEIDPAAPASASLIHDLKLLAPNLYLIGVGQTADPEQMVRALGLGCDDFSWPPLPSHLGAAIARAGEALFDRADRRTGRRGAIVGFLSAKGGCGATTLACHIAAEMACLSGEKTLLADLDVAAPLVGFMMSTESRYCLFDALANTHRLDSSYWGALVATRANLDILAMPSLAYRGQLPPGEAVAETFRFLRGQYRWIIADLGRGLGAYSDLFIDYVDRLLLVTTTEGPALEQARHLAGHFEAVRNPRVPANLVLNRVPRKRAAPPGDVGPATILFEISSDYRELHKAVLHNKLVSRKSRLGKEFTQAARILGGSLETDERGARVPWLEAVWQPSFR